MTKFVSAALLLLLVTPSYAFNNGGIPRAVVKVSRSALQALPSPEESAKALSECKYPRQFRDGKIMVEEGVIIFNNICIL